MTKDEALKLALEALEADPLEMVMQIGGCDRPEENSPALKMFVTFAKLVAAKEREACAKMCEEYFERVMASRIRTRGQANG